MMDSATQFASQDVSFNWVDVTDEFKEATQELQLGELLHDELFGLFEAMSAIEMMDPKMDAGMLMMSNKLNKKVMNFDQSVKAGKLKINNLQIDEQIGIIDDTFGCLVTWLEGHSMAQTVFTNLYLHNPNAVEDKCIKAFSIVTLKLVDIMRDFVTKAGVFEEEDFQPVVYGYQLACDVNDTKANAMIREVEEEMQKRAKINQRSSTTTTSNSGSTTTTTTNSGPTDDEYQLASALYTRLKFCRLFFQSLTLLKKEVLTKIQQPKKATPVNGSIVPDDVEKYLQQSHEALQTWKQTLHLGIQPDVSNSSDHRADYPTIMGFEPLVNQRLLPPTFPRYTSMKTRNEAVIYLESLVNRLRHICKIYECVSYSSALEFFNDFSKSSLPSCVLSRSILQVLYLPQSSLAFGTVHVSELLRDAVRTFIRPPSLHPKSPILANNTQAKEYLDVFFCHCVRPMSTLTQICGHNRARQREKLAQILEELATLQDEAEKLDAFLHNAGQKLEPPCNHLGYYSTWILYHTLNVMIQYLLSGFELELYAAHEYPYIFWYLYEFLFGWMVSTLNRASNSVIEQEAIYEQMQLQQSKGRSNKKVKPKKRKQRPHQREIQLNQALQQLCGGFNKCIHGFKIDEKLKLPWSGLNTEQVRYDHRFAPFNNVIAPPLVSYNQYRDMTEQKYMQFQSSDLYATSCKCFQQAKVFLESISEPDDEIAAYLKIAKTNFVVIKLLLSGHKKDSKNLPDFDFSTHKNFPIIRIL